MDAVTSEPSTRFQTARITSISDPVRMIPVTLRSELKWDTCTGLRINQAEMVDSGDVDAVIVTAPAHLNNVVAMDAVERGVPVLIEKPPALSLKGVIELREAAERSGSKVMVAFNRRFNPLIRAAIDVIRESGQLRQIVAEFHKDIHDFTDDPRYSPIHFRSDANGITDPFGRYRDSHGRCGGQSST